MATKADQTIVANASRIRERDYGTKQGTRHNARLIVTFALGDTVDRNGPEFKRVRRALDGVGPHVLTYEDDITFDRSGNVVALSDEAMALILDAGR